MASNIVQYRIEINTYSEFLQVEILTMKMANKHRIQKTEDIAAEDVLAT